MPPVLPDEGWTDPETPFELAPRLGDGYITVTDEIEQEENIVWFHGEFRICDYGYRE